jgi:hypothetical protein
MDRARLERHRIMTKCWEWVFHKQLKPTMKLCPEERLSIGYYFPDQDIRRFMRENRAKIIEMRRWSAREYAATPTQDLSKMLADFHERASAKLEHEWFRTCSHAKKADFLNLVREIMKTEYSMQDGIKRGFFVPQPLTESNQDIGQFKINSCTYFSFTNSDCFGYSLTNELCACRFLLGWNILSEQFR